MPSVGSIFFSLPSPGVIWAKIERESDSTPERLATLVQTVESLSRYGLVSIVAEFGPTVRLIGAAAIQQWVALVSKPGVKLIAAAAVTESPLVRLAAQTVGLAGRVKGTPLSIRAFSAVPPALKWATAAAAGQPPEFQD